MLNYKDNGDSSGGLFGDMQNAQRSTAGNTNPSNPKPPRTGGLDPVQSGGGMGWGDQNRGFNPMPLPGGPTDFQPRPQGGSTGDFGPNGKGPGWILPPPNQMSPSGGVYNGPQGVISDSSHMPNPFPLNGTPSNKGFSGPQQYGVWDQAALAQTNPQSIFSGASSQPQMGMPGGPMPLPGGPQGFEPMPRGGSLGDTRGTPTGFEPRPVGGNLGGPMVGPNGPGMGGPNGRWAQDGNDFGGGGPMPLPGGPTSFVDRPQGGSLGDNSGFNPMEGRRRNGPDRSQLTSMAGPSLFQDNNQAQQMNPWLMNYLRSTGRF